VIVSKSKKSREEAHNKEGKLSSRIQASRYPQKTPLDMLAEERMGGPRSIEGYNFQFWYAVYKTLSHFATNVSQEEVIRLEGVEDVDIISTFSEFIQVKSSKNKFNASTFWDADVLQNFAEAYIIDGQSRFRFVHNMDFAKGYLYDLANASKRQTPLSSSDLEFWQKKFDDFKNSEKAKRWNWANFDLGDFLSTITFEKLDESSLRSEARRLLILNHDVASGNEQQYLNALYILVKDTSRQKQEIKQNDLISCIDSVKEDIAKGPVLLAVQRKWLNYVDFYAEINADSMSSYFEGKAARPTHIAAGLPVRRGRWEERVLRSFRESEVIVIRASSGQGKSTLAWQVAFDLQKEGWTPFELISCEDGKMVGEIARFIESRVKVGKRPLIIIDGLRREVSAWHSLVKYTLDLQVKYIVTTRAEDWYHFGGDQSQFRLKIVDVEMNKEEAKEIFDLFKNGHKLYPTINSWQAAWEKVADRGLLIEYVYLLTKGEMIKERLSHQISHLDVEPDGKSKLEILRLVSAADLCCVRLSTSSLVRSIESRIGFVGDRGQCLKSLEEEYYIQIEDKEYVKGLHPVRSKHIADLLHKTLPLRETLFNLLCLIEADAIFDFSAYAPLLVTGKQRTLLLNQVAAYVADKSYGDIVNVIDGLFSTDALQHWKENQSSYDDIFAQKMGVFAIFAFPWSGTNIDDFAVGRLKPVESLSSKIYEIRKTFNPKKFDTHRFIQALSSASAKTEFANDLSGLGRLALWFLKFDVACPPFLKINEAQLWDALQSLELEDSGELFAACYKICPEMYQAFLNKCKPEIVGMLKTKTNSLTISENNSDLLIEYFIELESKNSLSEQSVNRINKIVPFLYPQYKTYSTQGLWPPDLASYIKFDESKKQISLKSLPSPFDIHVNKIWKARIDANYESPSVYDWQKHWHTIRNKSQELATEYIEAFEALILQDQKRFNKGANKIAKLKGAIISLLDSGKEFPTKLNAEVDSEKFEKELKDISDWASPWRRFITQQPTSRQNQISYFNRLNFAIQDTCIALLNMQIAYDKIAAASFSYFNVSRLKDQEKKTYHFLLKIVFFLALEPDKIGHLAVPRSAVNQWWAELDKKRIEKINKVLTHLEKDIQTEFIRPLYTVQRGSIREAAIGMKGLKPDQFDEVFLKSLIRDLSNLAEIEIDQYLLMFIDDENHLQRRDAILLTKDCLSHVRAFKGTAKEFEWSNYNEPLLVLFQEDTLQSLPEITLKIDPSLLLIRNITVNLWRVTEVRRRLSANGEVESAWMKELVDILRLELNDFLASLKAETSQETWKAYNDLVEAVLSGDESYTSGLF
jgi:hypothetical protein